MASNVKKKKKEKRHIERGHAHIQSSFNNTLVTLTDTNGNAISWSSAGSLGFKLKHRRETTKYYCTPEQLKSLFRGFFVHKKAYLCYHTL